jgi:uncharacterized protein YegJ (DUF2314 family)
MVLALLSCGIDQRAFADDKTVPVSKDDAEMNSAIARARSTLPKFWAHLAKPRYGEELFALKLGLTDGTSVEHFWCGQIEGNSKSATCVIDNDPEVVMTVKAGDRVAVKPQEISDWMISKGGKILGGETIRVLLPRLNNAEADDLRATLSEESLD